MAILPRLAPPPTREEGAVLRGIRRSKDALGDRLEEARHRHRTQRIFRTPGPDFPGDGDRWGSIAMESIRDLASGTKSRGRTERT
jgi:hypothetical protein